MCSHVALDVRVTAEWWPGSGCGHYRLEVAQPDGEPLEWASGELGRVELVEAVGHELHALVLELAARGHACPF